MNRRMRQKYRRTACDQWKESARNLPGRLASEGRPADSPGPDQFNLRAGVKPRPVSFEILSSQCVGLFDGRKNLGQGECLQIGFAQALVPLQSPAAANG